MKSDSTLDISIGFDLQDSFEKIDSMDMGGTTINRIFTWMKE